MGILDFFRNNKKETKQDLRYASMLNNTTPIFSQFGTNIYASDVVQQALYTIVTEMRKLNPKHVRREGFDFRPVYDHVSRVLNNPNVLMTKSDFLEKITWLVLLNYNAFVYIEREPSGKITALWPVQPSNVTFLESASEIFVEMEFLNGESYILPYSSFVHIKTHYSVNDHMGGNYRGQPDNDALLKTLELNNTLLQGVEKSIISSYAVNGIIKYNTMLDDGKKQEEIEKFNAQLRNSESGILPMDMKSEFVQFNRDIAIVDDNTLKFLDEKILRHFGVPLCILEGEYTTEQYEAFYQRTLEPLVVNYSEAFTKKLFTEREQLGYENRVYFYPKELTFMSTSQTLQMVHELGQTGTLYENEKRAAFGFEPLEELVGVRLQSLNFVNVNDAKLYQVGNEVNIDGDESL